MKLSQPIVTQPADQQGVAVQPTTAIEKQGDAFVPVILIVAMFLFIFGLVRGTR